MSARVVRLLPFAVADGPGNMAADEALLLSAADTGVASLRFYQWEPATLSLGYFQHAAQRHSFPRLATLPMVRRPSGGKALVHHHELTYALALPAVGSHEAVRAWIPRMHRAMIVALQALGVPGDFHVVAPGEERTLGDFLCFLEQAPGDLVCRGHKIAGSAQRKYRHSLLQHGSLLLAQSAHTPELPGIVELTGRAVLLCDLLVAMRQAVAAEIRQDGDTLEEGAWTEGEMQTQQRIAHDKYETTAWNERR